MATPRQPSPSSRARAHRIEIWRAEVAALSECTCARLSLLAAAAAASSSAPTTPNPATSSPTRLSLAPAPASAGNAADTDSDGPCAACRRETAALRSGTAGGGPAGLLRLSKRWRGLRANIAHRLRQKQQRRGVEDKDSLDGGSGCGDARSGGGGTLSPAGAVFTAMYRLEEQDRAAGAVAAAAAAANQKEEGEDLIRPGDDDDDNDDDDNNIDRIIAQKQARLRRAEKLLGRQPAAAVDNAVAA